jgi:hypothetical protein
MLDSMCRPYFRHEHMLRYMICYRLQRHEYIELCMIFKLHGSLPPQELCHEANHYPGNG